MSTKELKSGHDKNIKNQKLPRPQKVEEAEQQETYASTILQNAGLDPRLLVPRDVKQLQRTIGNRATGQLLAGSSPLLQRQELSEEEEELQLQPDIPVVGPEGGPVAPDVQAAIQNAKGGGQPLQGPIQAQMGEALGYDFSSVRVHTDSEADTLNQQLSAKAFTTGQDIFFRRGEYNPGSGSGRELIAHELTHVVQQGTGRASGGGSSMTVRPAGDAFEREADLVVGTVSEVDLIAVGGNVTEQNGEKSSQTGNPRSIAERLAVAGGEAASNSVLSHVVQRDLVGYSDVIELKKGHRFAPVPYNAQRRGAFTWAINWITSSNTLEGYIVQRIHATTEGKSADGGTIRENDTYWERWKVDGATVTPKGTQSNANDAFVYPPQGEGTEGYITMRGEAFYVAKGEMKGNWVLSRPGQMAGGLEWTHDDPKLQPSDGVIRRGVESSWVADPNKEYKLDKI